MWRKVLALSAVVLCLAALLGCGGSEFTASPLDPPDAGDSGCCGQAVQPPDAGSDAADGDPAVGQDSGLDAGCPSCVDASDADPPDANEGGVTQDGSLDAADADPPDATDAGPDSGSTTDAGDAGSVCSPPQTACDGQCVDLETDTNNCGACGHSCQGGSCQNGACQVVILATQQESNVVAGEIGVAKGDVFWPASPAPNTTACNYSVKDIATNNIGAPTSAASSLGIVTGVTADSTAIYWLGLDGCGSSTWGIWMMPYGGSPTLVASGLTNPNRFVVDATNIYYTDGTNVVQVNKVVHTSTKLFSMGQSTFGIAVDATTVYWTDTKAGTVMSAPIDTGSGLGPAQTLASGQTNPWAIAVDDTNVYWSNIGDWLFTNGTPNGSMSKVLKTGGTPKVLASALTRPVWIVTDTNTVYWAEASGSATYVGGVYSVPIGGGTLSQLYSGDSFSLAQDPTALYWTGQDVVNGPLAIMKLAK